MALVIKDRVKETTTTTGTGTYTLAGAVSGFETFTANLSNSDTTYYVCTDNTDFEVGLGTFTSSGTTLARTTILASSNSNNAVNWSSGTRSVFMTYPADKAVFEDASNNINGTFVGNITGNVTGNTSGTAATVTGAAQTNITSVGTLSSLATSGDITVGDDLFVSGGLIDLKNDGAFVSQIKFYCESSNQHAQTLIGAPHSESASNTLTLPSTGGNARLVTTASTATLTNKTFDVEGTGNSISNIDVADLKSGVLDTDISSVSGSDDTLASAKAIKTYVDAQVTAQDLDASTDSGTIAIDLDSETLSVAGGEGINTSATGNEITIAGEDATTSNKGVAKFNTADFAVSSGDVTIKASGVSNTQLAGSIANSKLANSSVTVSDGSNTSAIALGGTLTFSGTSNEVEVAESSGTVTIGLPSAITANVTGNLTGNASGTAATVTGAAQTNITSLGTLTALTVDEVGINGKVITMTGSSGDTATITVGTNGTLDIATTDGGGAAGNIQITADGTAELAGTTVTLDSSGGITLDADGGTITFADAGSSLGTITSDGYTGNVVGNLTGNVTGNTSGTAATVTGAAQSSITSLGTLTTLTVDNVIINGSTIGHTGDTDLMTVASGVLTVAGEVDATSLDISGDADIDGTLEADAITVAGATLSSVIQDEATALAIALG